MAFGGTTSCCIPGFTVAINYKSSHPLRKNTHSTRKLLHVHCVTTPNTYTRVSIENLNPSYVGVAVKPTQPIFNPPTPPHNHSNRRFGGREANTIDIQSTKHPLTTTPIADLVHCVTTPNTRTRLYIHLDKPQSRDLRDRHLRATRRCLGRGRWGYLDTSSKQSVEYSFINGPVVFGEPRSAKSPE